MVDKAGDTVKVALHQDYFKSHLCDIPELEMQVSKDTLVQMYKDMVSMRRMEMAADQASCRARGTSSPYVLTETFYSRS